MTPGTMLHTALTAALLVTAPLASRAAGEEGRDGVTFVSPAHGSLVVDERVILAGRLPPGASGAAFLLNGRALAGVSRRGSSFSAFLSPARGFNEVEVRTGKGPSARLTFVYKLKAAGKKPYRYHQALLEGVCEPCHAAEGGSAGGGDSSLCFQCHGKKAVLYPHVHGPVAAGKCLVCHDPHGSSFPAFTRSETKVMCTFCHDQLSTAQHTSNRTRMCTICHNPHYSMRKYLLKDSF